MNNNTMTEGRIHRSLLNFAVPMFISSLVQQLYVTVDSIIVGKYVGARGLAAIGVTSQIIMFTVSLGIGLLMGISTVISEHYGAGDWKKVRQTEVIAIYFVLAAYAMKLIVAIWFTEAILSVTNTPAEVMRQANQYLKITFFFGIFSYGYSMCIYVLRACGDSLRPLYFLFISAGSNVALDIVFVKYLHLGVAGAAAATMIAEGLALVMCLAYIVFKKKELVVKREDFREIKVLLIYTLKLSLPTCVQMCAITICSILVQAVINKYGTYVVAGYTAAQKIEQLVNMVITALASALLTFVAQNRGAGQYERIRQAKRFTMQFTIGISVLMSLCILLAGEQLLGWFADDGGQSIIIAGEQYLLVTSGFYFLMGMNQVNSNTLRGMADAKAPLLIGSMQIIANLAAIFLLEPHFNIMGIWYSVVVSWLLCCVISAVRMRKYKHFFHIRRKQMNQKYKKVHITLKPFACEGMVDRLQTTVVLDRAEYEKGQVFDCLPVSLASCLTANYGSKDFQLEDERGSLEFICEEGTGIFGPDISYRFDRDVQGKLCITYSCKSILKDAKKSEPSFCLYKKSGGCTAAGMIFLLLPQDEIFDFTLDYDLSQLEEGSTGLCGYGEGVLHRICTAEDLKNTFFCIGKAHRYHKEGSKLHLLWFDSEMNLVEEFCKTTSEYFEYMEKMFHDDDIPYYIFLYPMDTTKLTGTALTRTCNMGFGHRLVKDVKEVENVLAHELVHNWASITGEQHLNSLYAEGTAEYYSNYISYKSGHNSLDEFVDVVNEKLKSFYSNPRCEEDYREAYDLSWTHSYAQRIPYGRGLLLMLHLDTMIRGATGDEHCLDDVVVGLIDESKKGHEPTWGGFLAAADALLDGRATEKGMQVQKSGPLLPPEKYFGENYILVDCGVLQEDNGFDDTVRYANPREVTGLKPDSNAAKAGLKEGDLLLSFPVESNLYKSETIAAQYKVKRGMQELEISYIPRGKRVSCWQYRKREK